MYRLSALFLLFSVGIFAQSAQDNNRFFMGQSFEQSGNFAKAKEIYQELYSRNKNNYQYFDALNRTFVQMKEYQSSIALIEEKLQNSPDDVNLLGLLGKTYHMSGDDNKAFSIWDNAADKAAGNPAVYKVVANFAIERREFRKAVELLKKGKENSGADESFSHDLANLYALLMQYENAAEEFCYILLQKPEQYNLVEARILQYINKPEALQQTIKAVKSSRKNTAVNNLLGRLYLEAKDFEQAYSVYQDLEDSGESIGADISRFAQYAYSEHEYSYAAKAFKEIIKRYPQSPYVPGAKLGYAKTLEAELINESEGNEYWRPVVINKVKDPKKLNEVISAYMELIKLYALSEVGLEAHFRIGMLKFHYQDNPDEAEEHFYTIVKSAPYSRFTLDAYAEIGDIHLSKGKVKESIETFNKILSNERVPDDIKRYAEYRLAQLKFYQGDFIESRNLLGRLVEHLKDYSANDAIELSLLLNSKMNDSSNLILFSEAELLKMQRKYEAAAQKYREIYSGQGIFLMQHLAKIREAEMELAMDNTDSAVLLLQKIADEKEKNIYADKALYLLGKIYEVTLENPGKAIEIFEDLLISFPNSLYIDEAREEILKLRTKLS